MKDVVKFIAEMGKNANLRLDLIDIESIIDNQDFDPELRQALLAKDQAALEKLLNARTKIVCLIVPAKDDDEESGEEEISSQVVNG